MFSFFREGNNFKELNFFHFKELQTIQTIPVSAPVKCQNNCFCPVSVAAGGCHRFSRDVSEGCTQFWKPLAGCCEEQFCADIQISIDKS